MLRLREGKFQTAVAVNQGGCVNGVAMTTIHVQRVTGAQSAVMALFTTHTSMSARLELTLAGTSAFS